MLLLRIEEGKREAEKRKEERRIGREEGYSK